MQYIVLNILNSKKYMNWKIPDGSLPKGSDVRNRTSAFADYQEIAGFIVLDVQFEFIIIMDAGKGKPVEDGSLFFFPFYFDLQI